MPRGNPRTVVAARLDTDVIRWLDMVTVARRARSRGTVVNELLREAMRRSGSEDILPSQVDDMLEGLR